MSTRRILVTGPVGALEPWLEAADAGGWIAVVWPLVHVRQQPGLVVERGGELPEWIAVTSANALPALERAAAERPEILELSFGAVGENTPQRARAIGFRPTLVAPTEAELARALLELPERPSRVLWPRGSLAKDFGAALRAEGLTVLDPIVYATVPLHHDEAPPPADAVLFASPSGVRAWHESARPSALPARVIAIGPTTAAALERAGVRRGEVHALETPTPRALAALLRSWTKERE